MQRCEEAILGRYTVPQRLVGSSPTPIIGHDLVYIGPRGWIPRMVSENLQRRFGLDVFRNPLRVAWMLQVRLNGELEHNAVGACEDQGWVARYATLLPLKTGPKNYLSTREARVLRRDVFDVEGPRAVELVHGNVEISMPPHLQMWIDQCRESWGC